LRWLAKEDLAQSLPSITAQQLSSFDFVVGGSGSYVEIIQIQAYCAYLSQSNSAIYNVTEGLGISLVNPIVNGYNTLNYIKLSNNNQPFFILAEKFSNSGEIRFNVEITGGDVKRLTGIDPGAGDTVNMFFSFSYKF